MSSSLLPKRLRILRELTDLRSEQTSIIVRIDAQIENIHVVINQMTQLIEQYYAIYLRTHDREEKEKAEKLWRNWERQLLEVNGSLWELNERRRTAARLRDHYEERMERYMNTQLYDRTTWFDDINPYS
jgi:hypothetical protein